jgi:mediator of RNA polymerase II transcription subunit 31
MNATSTAIDTNAVGGSTKETSYHENVENTNNKSSSTATTTTATTTAATNTTHLPTNRFELELEFIQALSSPAYLHFLATSRSSDHHTSSGSSTTAENGGTQQLLLQDPALRKFLIYLRDTWSQPDYARFLLYPHCLYFLNLLIDKPDVVSKEWTLPQFRDFCHQQQFLAWQHRHATLYGGVGGSNDSDSSATGAIAASKNEDGRQRPTEDNDTTNG